MHCINSRISDQETNPFLKKLDRLDEAKLKYAGSEWLLNFLRTERCLKPPVLTDEQLLLWQKTLP